MLTLHRIVSCRTWQLYLHGRIPIPFVPEAEPPKGSPAPNEDAPLCRQRQRVRATTRRLHHPAGSGSRYQSLVCMPTCVSLLPGFIAALPVTLSCDPDVLTVLWRTHF